jgi:hypothetical protein
VTRFAVATFVAFGLCASAHAEDSRGPPPESLFGGIVQERDIALIFGYAREALSAAVEGREVAPPEELTQRAEAIGGEMKRRGFAAGRAILDAIESAVRDTVREPRRQSLPRDPGRRI